MSSDATLDVRLEEAGELVSLTRLGERPRRVAMEVLAIAKNNEWRRVGRKEEGAVVTAEGLTSSSRHR